jgi:pyruvate dehydrogenase phosphatase
LVLNNEHNARVAVEAERLGREHPNEANVVKCKPDNEHACYVKGRLQPTRSLGDAELKYQVLLHTCS